MQITGNRMLISASIIAADRVTGVAVFSGGRHRPTWKWSTSLYLLTLTRPIATVVGPLTSKLSTHSIPGASHESLSSSTMPLVPSPLIYGLLLLESQPWLRTL